MAKNKSLFKGRKKFNRAEMNSDMDGEGNKASHVQTKYNENVEMKLSWKQTFSPTILESKVPQKFLSTQIVFKSAASNSIFLSNYLNAVSIRKPFFATYCITMQSILVHLKTLMQI